MPSITVEAVPATPGRPAHLKIVSSPGVEVPEAVVLLERAKAALLSQNVPALDGEPALVERATAPELARLLRNGEG